MNILLSKEVEFVPTFYGNDKLPEAEKFKAKLRVLSVGHLLVLADHLTAAGITQGQIEVSKVSLTIAKPLVEACRDILPSYVTISNLFVGGEAVTSQSLLDLAPFMQLALELLMKLVEISTLSENDTGNSNEQRA